MVDHVVVHSLIFISFSVHASHDEGTRSSHFREEAVEVPLAAGRLVLHLRRPGDLESAARQFATLWARRLSGGAHDGSCRKPGSISSGDGGLMGEATALSRPASALRPSFAARSKTFTSSLTDFVTRRPATKFIRRSLVRFV